MGGLKTDGCGGSARAPWPSMEWPLQGHFLRHHESLKPRALGEPSAPAKRLPQMWLVLRMWEPPRTPTSDPSSSRQNIPSAGVSTQDPARRSFLGHLAGGTVWFLNRCCLPPAPKVLSGSAAFEPGRQTSFAHLFKVSQVHAHKHTRPHTPREAPRRNAQQVQGGLWQGSAFRLAAPPAASTGAGASRFQLQTGGKHVLLPREMWGQGKTRPRQEATHRNRKQLPGLCGQGTASVSPLLVLKNGQLLAAWRRCTYLFLKHHTRAGTWDLQACQALLTCPTHGAWLPTQLLLTSSDPSHFSAGPNDY